MVVLAELSVKVNSATSSLRRALKLPKKGKFAQNSAHGTVGRPWKRDTGWGGGVGGAGVTVTFISLWRKQSEDVVQPEPHHRCTRLQVSAVDLDDGRDTGRVKGLEYH